MTSPFHHALVYFFMLFLLHAFGMSLFSYLCPSAKHLVSLAHCHNPISMLFIVGPVTTLSFVPPCVPTLPVNKTQAEPLPALAWPLQQLVEQWPPRPGLWYCLLLCRVCVPQWFITFPVLSLFMHWASIEQMSSRNRCPYIPSTYIPFTSSISFPSTRPTNLLYCIRKASYQELSYTNQVCR